MGYRVGFLMGAASSLFWHSLPGSVLIGIAFVISALLLVASSSVKWLSGLLFGVVWLSVFGHLQQAKLFNENELETSIHVEGVIESLITEQMRQQFVLTINQASWARLLYPRRLKLNWFSPQWPLKQGQVVRLEVKLKPPFGLANEGSFSYQTWLLSQSIVATGYVVTGGHHQLIKQTTSTRQKVLDEIDGMNLTHAQWILALSVGFRGLLDSNDWQLMQQTGLAHVLAISGLHLTVAFGLAYGVCGFVLSALLAGLKRQDWINVHHLSLIFALAISFYYSFLAGFSVPTLRALLALGLFVFFRLIKHNVSKLSGFLWCVSLLVLVFPSSIFSTSFWLSVSAVAAILFAVWRLGSRPSRKALGQTLVYALKVQGVMTLLVTPLAIYQFGNLPVYSLVFNLVLVPLISLFLVPMCLVGTATLIVFPSAAGPLFRFINYVFKLGVEGLLGLSELTNLAWSVGQFSISSLLFLQMFILFLLLPPLPVSKYMTSFLVLPLVFDLWRVPEKGWYVHVLDVGQGLSVVIEKNRRAIVYDTGPAFDSGFNMAQAVVLPFLRARGIDRIDQLILSHQDNDHSGGEAMLMPYVDSINKRCEAGTQWSWLGIGFRVLWPSNGEGIEGTNETSCVVLISDGYTKVLLPGDIEKAQERQLVLQLGNGLKANILLAPHHGSNTSSTRLFVRHVKPDWVVFSRGFKNRWGFPKSQVVETYHKYNANLLDTVENGQVSFHILENRVNVERYRQQIQPFWYRNYPF